MSERAIEIFQLAWHPLLAVGVVWAFVWAWLVKRVNRAKVDR